ncbi:uncharacterized protein LOC125426194 [Sphaerodactylus townsendi]|uniref:uncharacterized protein LOC125426194 n=1 Tax=Sphaerodactylus townsendi TaxID=933632 RepID=UPI002026DFBB|nr:uncharacterized protein LOC125426194 [Sphaerodactylus townsendi]
MSPILGMMQFCICDLIFLESKNTSGRTFAPEWGKDRTGQSCPWNVAKCNEKSLKERSFPNGVGCSPSKLSRSETPNDKSLEPISACPERSWLLGPQSGLFSGDSESLETTPRTEPFQGTKPEADQHQIHGVKSVRLMPETSHPNQSQITSPCSPAAQGPPPSEKDIEQEEEEEEEEKELQQLMLKLKDALSLQVQPGQTSALKKELLSAAEHVSKSFSGVLSQVSSPARKCQVSFPA